MFSMMPRTGTCTGRNMRSPFSAMVRATSWGVVTMTAPVNGTPLCQRELHVAGAGWQVDDEVVELTPNDTAHELLDQLGRHRAAPNHGRLLRGEEPHRHDPNSMRFERDHTLRGVDLGTRREPEHRALRRDRTRRRRTAPPGRLLAVASPRDSPRPSTSQPLLCPEATAMRFFTPSGFCGAGATCPPGQDALHTVGRRGDPPGDVHIRFCDLGKLAERLFSIFADPGPWPRSRDSRARYHSSQWAHKYGCSSRIRGSRRRDPSLDLARRTTYRERLFQSACLDYNQSPVAQSPSRPVASRQSPAAVSSASRR